MSETFDYDWLVIGSGFGGSVSSLRLTEKGYRVGVLECGRRFADHEFPESTSDYRRYFWRPKIGWKGIFRLTTFRHVAVVSGCGVGGGSLGYANTLYVPPKQFFEDPQWAGMADWEAELAPHYAEAQRMLGVTTNPYDDPADQLLRELGEELGVSDSYKKTPVGVYFGEPAGVRAAVADGPGEPNGAAALAGSGAAAGNGATDAIAEPGAIAAVRDPYFGGEGPDRTPCSLCGRCMVGCPHGSKNTLVKNYLYLAEKHGATVMPERTVIDIRPLGAGDGSDGYEIESVRSGAWVRRDRQVHRARGVVVSAGPLGTNTLLQRCRLGGSLPRISSRLGELVRTNSEAILAVTVPEDYPDNLVKRVAITSSIYPDPHTHIETVTYGNDGDSMSRLYTLLTGDGTRVTRPLKLLGQIARHPGRFAQLLRPKNWSKRTIIILVMQTLDNAMALRPKRGPFKTLWLSTEQDPERPNPTFIPVANQAAEWFAKRTGGIAQSSMMEAALNIPTTAHILGGAVIGADAQRGVVDAHQCVFGYENLLVCDGSAIPANVGVNPSLTITALAEHAMGYVPAAGQGTSEAAEEPVAA